MSEDYYELLGVSRTADADELKKAYRKLARQHHPDANPGDADAEELFKKVNVAYETLSDPDRRRQYDTFGADGMSAGGPGDGFGGFGVGFSDLFDAFFGQGSPFGATAPGGARGGRPAGDDRAIELRLDFVEAIHGAEKNVDVRTQVGCVTCEATGAKPGTQPELCQVCRGRGEVQQVRRTVLGQIVTSSVCPECRGAGQRIADPCPDCRGDGRVIEAQTLTLRVPAGVDDGAQLRLSGRGDVGLRGAPAGDLYVQMRIDAPPTGWSRDGVDLHLALTVPMTTAALGGKIGFDTLDGEQITVDIVAGTQPGETRKYRGRGVPRLRGGGKGDLFVDLAVQTPTALEPEQEALLRKLAELRGENTETPSVVSRLKKAFR